MQPPDVCLVRPWFDPVVFGVRSSFAWEPAYLVRMRVRYTIAYWNPSPGAVVTVADERIGLDRQHLLVIPAGTWFERDTVKPFDHWWAHVRVRSEPSRPGAQQIAVDGDLGLLTERLWRRCWNDGVASPGAMADAHAVLALALSRIDWVGEARVWADPRLGELARWLESQHYPNLANDELAGRLGMHPKAFCRLFSHEAGVSPQDWLRGKRLDLAAERLDQGTTVEAAAEEGGFADRFHFGRLFARHHGVSPGHYRRLALARREEPPAEHQGRRTRRP